MSCLGISAQCHALSLSSSPRILQFGPLNRAIGKVNTLLDKRSPFANAGVEEGRLHPIVALEVEWSAVAGIEFTFLLHADARLVLEARHVTKRLFNSMEDVKCFYDCGSATSPDGVAMTCGAAWMAQGPGRDKQYSAQGSGRDKQYSAARVQHPV